MSMRNALYGATVKAMEKTVARNQDLPERVVRRELVRATVAETFELAPNLRRITLTAPDFGRLSRNGADEYVALVLPHPGHPLEMPDADIVNIRAAVRRLPVDVRWYTIRRLEGTEMDVDVVVHGDSGPGTAWARRVRPGDSVGVRFHGHCHYPHSGPQFYLADATSAPALRSILEGASPSELADTHVLLAAPADELEPGAGLPRSDGSQPASVTIVEAANAVGDYLADAPFAPADLAYAWLCGESSMVTSCRKELVRRGMPKDRILFSGYWRSGTARA